MVRRVAQARDSHTGVWPIVRETFAAAPLALRRQMHIIGVLWLLLIILQVWDSRDGRGPAGVAEFLSALLGATGAALLGIAHILQQTIAHAAQRPRAAGDVEAVQKVLVALPALGFGAGVALGGATMLMLMRVLLGVELLLAAIGLTAYVLLLTLAALTVMRSARTLFHHAEQDAAAAGAARAAASEAQVAALQARMNPHFLFNALNTVAAFVRTNPSAAERVVETLADVLRRTLDRSTESMSTVAAEIAYVRAYLALEQERWGDRLRVEWAIGEDAAGLPLPPLVLQPLVENALRHGLGGRLEGGTIRIAVARDGDAIAMSVEDDGEGFAPGYREHMGLGNLRERLTALYSSRATIAIDPTTTGGRVVLSVPCAFS